MNKKLTKMDLIDKVSEKLSDRRFARGGKRKSWKSKYNLPYAKEDVIKPVLNAFFDVMIDAIAEGDSVGVYDYFKIEPRYMKAKRLKTTGFKDTHIEKVISPHYKVAIVPGEKMRMALGYLTERGEVSENEQHKMD